MTLFILQSNLNDPRSAPVDILPDPETISKVYAIEDSCPPYHGQIDWAVGPFVGVWD